MNPSNKQLSFSETLELVLVDLQIHNDKLIKKENELKNDLAIALIQNTNKKNLTKGAECIYKHQRRMCLLKMIMQKASKLYDLMNKTNDQKILVNKVNIVDVENVLWGLRFLSNKESQLKESLDIYDKCLQHIVKKEEYNKIQSFSNVDSELRGLTIAEASNAELEKIIKNISEDISDKKDSMIKDPKPIQPKKPSPFVMPKNNIPKEPIEEEKDEIDILRRSLSNFKGDKEQVMLDENLRISHVNKVNLAELKIYDTILKEYESRNLLFVDNEFSTNQSSLSNDLNLSDKWKNLIWRRATDIYSSKNLTLFGNLSPTNIIQGSLGDCYFLSAVSVLSERVELVKKIFHSKQINKCGAYSIWLCDSGEWKNIVIDDFIPCHIDTGMPAFSRSTGQEIWVILLEKAYAKLFGSYQSIEAGIPSDAFRALTGASTEYFDAEDNEGLTADDKLAITWNYILTNLQSKFLLTAGTRGKKVNNMNQSFYGLASLHCYAILNAIEVDIDFQRKEKLIQIRNPWGKEEWKGDWSVHSKLWTPALLQKLKYNPKLNNGIFWINLKDFCLHFGYLCVCKIHDNFHYKFIKLNQKVNDSISIVTLNVSYKTYAYISLIQKERRHFRDIDDYEYSRSNLFIVKIDDEFNFKQFIYGKSRMDLHNTYEGLLDPGLYLVYIDMDYNQGFYNDVVLSAYSQEEIEINDITGDDETNRIFLKNIIKLHATTTKEKIKVTDFSDQGGYGIVKYIGNLGLFYYIYYSNKSNNTILFDYLEMSNAGYVIDDPIYKDQKEIIKTIEPDKDEFILLKMANTDYIAHLQYYTKSALMQILKENDLISFALASPKKETFASGGLHVIAHKFTYKGGIAIYFENVSNKLAMVNINFQILENYEVNGTTKTFHQLYLPPKEGALLHMKVINIFSYYNLEYYIQVTGPN